MRIGLSVRFGGVLEQGAAVINRAALGGVQAGGAPAPAPPLFAASQARQPTRRGRGVKARGRGRAAAAPRARQSATAASSSVAANAADADADAADAPADAPPAAADDLDADGLDSTAFTPQDQLLLARATATSPRLRVIAVDPGRVAIVTCGEWVTDKVTGRPRWATWRLSRSEFYAKTGYHESMRKRSLWNLEVADAHAALATVSVRTGRLDRFDAFLAVVETHLDDLWTNREHSRWMRLVRAPPPPCGQQHARVRSCARASCPQPPPPPAYASPLPPHAPPQDFRAKRAATKCREGFWRLVTGGRDDDGTRGVDPVFAYGDAGFASSGKGGMAAPTSAMRRSCVAVNGRSKVVAVDEFNSTAKHAVTPDGSVCGRYLSDVVDQRVGHCKRARCCGSGTPPRGAASGVLSRGLKRCPTCFIFEDRDANACRNILAAFWSSREGRGRPGYLRDTHVPAPGPMGGAAGRPAAYTRHGA